MFVFFYFYVFVGLLLSEHARTQSFCSELGNPPLDKISYTSTYSLLTVLYCVLSVFALLGESADIFHQLFFLAMIQLLLQCI
jgi:hypothetical protein